MIFEPIFYFYCLLEGNNTKLQQYTRRLFEKIKAVYVVLDML